MRSPVGANPLVVPLAEAYLVLLPERERDIQAPVESRSPGRASPRLPRPSIPYRPQGTASVQTSDPTALDRALPMAGQNATAITAAEAHVPAASQAQGPRGAPDLSPAVVSRAISQSRGGIRSMAEASGAYIGDAPLSPAQRLSRDTERAGKEDCLREGSGLLSALTILYERATDKCSTR